MLDPPMCLLEGLRFRFIFCCSSCLLFEKINVITTLIDDDEDEDDDARDAIFTAYVQQYTVAFMLKLHLFNLLRIFCRFIVQIICRW